MQDDALYITQNALVQCVILYTAFELEVRCVKYACTSLDIISVKIKIVYIEMFQILSAYYCNECAHKL